MTFNKKRRIKNKEKKKETKKLERERITDACLALTYHKH